MELKTVSQSTRATFVTCLQSYWQGVLLPSEEHVLSHTPIQGLQVLAEINCFLAGDFHITKAQSLSQQTQDQCII
jgi:hypothetical protein